MLENLKPKRLILRKSPKWTPKKWKPIYEEIVLLSAAGKSNKDIGEFLGYSEQQISNILSCPAAMTKKEEIIVNVSAGFLESEGLELQKVARKCIERVSKVLFDDEIFEKAPLAIHDRSITFLKAVGKLQSGYEGTRVQNNIFIGKEVQRNLIDGLEKANRVQELHQIPEKV